jgi:hypothetical protein
VFPWGPRAQVVVSLYSAVGYLAVLPLPVLGATRLYHVGLSLVFAVTTSIRERIHARPAPARDVLRARARRVARAPSASF